MEVQGAFALLEVVERETIQQHFERVVGVEPVTQLVPVLLHFVHRDFYPESIPVAGVIRSALDVREEQGRLVRLLDPERGVEHVDILQTLLFQRLFILSVELLHCQHSVLNVIQVGIPAVGDGGLLLSGVVYLPDLDVLNLVPAVTLLGSPVVEHCVELLLLVLGKGRPEHHAALLALLFRLGRLLLPFPKVQTIRHF